MKNQQLAVASTGLKIRFRKECWFESGQGHHFMLAAIRAPYAPLDNTVLSKIRRSNHGDQLSM
jgi:hypothetical protein